MRGGDCAAGLTEAGSAPAPGKQCEGGLASADVVRKASRLTKYRSRLGQESAHYCRSRNYSELGIVLRQQATQ